MFHRKHNPAIQFGFEIKLLRVLRMPITETEHVFNRIEKQLELAKHLFPYSAEKNILKEKE